MCLWLAVAILASGASALPFEKETSFDADATGFCVVAVTVNVPVRPDGGVHAAVSRLENPGMTAPGLCAAFSANGKRAITFPFFDTVSVPVGLPAVVGANTTLNDLLAPAAKVNGKLMPFTL